MPAGRRRSFPTAARGARSRAAGGGDGTADRVRRAAAPALSTDRTPRSITDGVVLLRPGAPVAAFCIEAHGGRVGWIDVGGRADIRVQLDSAHREVGDATRALQLLVHHLAVEGRHHVATLRIDPADVGSQAMARRAGFEPQAGLDRACFERPIPPLEYADGIVRIRRRTVADLDVDLEATDEQHRRWLWTPRQRRAWCDLTTEERREHAQRALAAEAASFGTGPRWVFAVDRCDGRSGVALVECNLASEHAPRGTANIAYSAHPAHRGHGLVTRGVRLLLRFLADHTATREAAIAIDEANHPSHRVAAALGAEPVERAVIDGRPMIRYRMRVERA